MSLSVRTGTVNHQWENGIIRLSKEVLNLQIALLSVLYCPKVNHLLT